MSCSSPSCHIIRGLIVCNDYPYTFVLLNGAEILASLELRPFFERDTLCVAIAVFNRGYPL